MQEVLIAFRGSRGWDSLQQSPQEMEGYLEREEKKKKKGSGFSKWRRVYVLLADDMMEGFKKEKAAIKGKQPKWRLPLRDVTKLSFHATEDNIADAAKIEISNRWFCLETSEESHKFCTSNTQQFDRWIDVITEALERLEAENTTGVPKQIQKNDPYLSSDREEVHSFTSHRDSRASSSRSPLYGYVPEEKSRSESERRAALDESAAFLYNAAGLLWNGRAKECEDLLMTRATTNLHAASYHTLVAWFKAIVTEDPAGIKEAIYRLQTLEALASQRCHCYSDSSAMDYVKGLFMKTSKASATQMQETAGCLITAYCQLFLALLQFKLGSYVKGGLNLRRSWKTLDQCHKILQESDEDPGVHENYTAHVLFGVGSFHFVISLVPPSLLWIVQALGFEGNRKTGLELLQRVHESKTAIAPCATLFLLWIQIFFLEDDQAAQHLYDHIVNLFPDGILFHYMGAQLATRRGNIDAALKIYEHAYEHAAEWRQLQLIFHFEIGECYLMLSRFEEAIENYNAFLNENKTTSYRCWCVFNLGIAYCMLGKIPEAYAAFRKVSGYVRKHYSFDAYCLRKAREYLKNKEVPMDEAEKHLVMARFARQGRLWERCIEHLEQGRELIAPDNFDYLVQYYYLKGRALHSLGKLEEGEHLLLTAIDMKKSVKRETYIIPHAINDLGELYYDTERYEKAEETFKWAKSFSSYDFDKPLGRKINRNQDLLIQRNN